MVDSTPASTARSMTLDQTMTGDPSFDVEQIFQALLLNRTLADDDESSEGSSSGFPTARGSTAAETLRELRRSRGPLGEMSGEAFTRLLAGTLYEYNESVPPTPLASIRPIRLPSTSRLQSRGSDVGADTGRELDATLALLETAIEGDDGEHSTPLTRSVSGSAGFGLEVISNVGATATEQMFVSFVDSGRSSPSSGGGAGWTARSSDVEQPSLWSTARSEGRSDGFWRTARTVLGDSQLSALGGVLLQDRDGDGTVTAHVRDMLRQLAGDGDLDESLAESARRIGAVANGQRLSEDEIQALPKVKFDQVEQATCAICLEIYQQSEILTQLRCCHFFHSSCVTRWFQQSTQCPLCRAAQIDPPDNAV